MSQWIDRVVQYGILAVWIFLPLAFGSVHVWAYVSVEVAVWVLVGLAVISAALKTAESVERGAESVEGKNNLEFRI